MDNLQKRFMIGIHVERRCLVLLLALLVCFMPCSPGVKTVKAASVTVTSTTNVVDGNTISVPALNAAPGADGVISLHEAMIAADMAPTGPDTINFNIPLAAPNNCNITTGVCIISPNIPLPLLTTGLTTIDGYTQPGAQKATASSAAQLKIVINGTNAGNVDGFAIHSQWNKIEGLVINNFNSNGINLSGINAVKNTIVGNYIGTDVNGTSDMGN
jgi:hypothetical protein